MVAQISTNNKQIQHNNHNDTNKKNNRNKREKREEGTSR